MPRGVVTKDTKLPKSVFHFVCYHISRLPFELSIVPSIACGQAVVVIHEQIHQIKIKRATRSKLPNIITAIILAFSIAVTCPLVVNGMECCYIDSLIHFLHLLHNTKVVANGLNFNFGRNLIWRFI